MMVNESLPCIHTVDGGLRQSRRYSPGIVADGRNNTLAGVLSGKGVFHCPGQQLLTLTTWSAPVHVYAPQMQ